MYMLSNVDTVESFMWEGPRRFVACFMVLSHYLPEIIVKNHERISQASCTLIAKAHVCIDSMNLTFLMCVKDSCTTICTCLCRMSVPYFVTAIKVLLFSNHLTGKMTSS
jgi:hypothetical protein